jgi:hypothetical protein
MLEIQRRGMLVGMLVVVVGGVGGVRDRCSRSRMLVFTLLLIVGVLFLHS